MNKLLNMDIDKIVAAVVADDPDAAAVADDLAHSLREMQAGQFARQTEITLSPVAQTRHQTGLSQEKFTVLLEEFCQHTQIVGATTSPTQRCSTNSIAFAAQTPRIGA
ncbi:hypothetical protein [Kingella kingae]|uniref:hypothetical protein n=1 Tax=Kingella kingae TaxID=504 RepID=UPI0004062D38|nr:hypothetical protein [Kingella kingae]